MNPAATSFLSRSARNFLGLFTVRGLAALAPLLVMPHLVLVLGMESWGKISFAFSVAAFAGPIVLYGFSISATASIARADPGKDRIRLFGEFSSASLLISAAVLAVTAVGTILFKDSIPVTSAFMIQCAVISAVMTALIPSWYFLGVGSTSPLVYSQLLSRVGYVGLIFLLVKGPEHEHLVLPFSAICSFIGLAASWASLWNSARLCPLMWGSLGRVGLTLRTSFPTFILTFAPLLYNAGGIVFLGMHAGAKSVGQFAIVVTVTEAVLTIGRLLASALLPLLAQDRSQHRFGSALLVALGLMLAIALAASSGLIGDWLAGGSKVVVHLTLILAASVPFAFMQLAFNQNELAIHGGEHIAARLVIISSVISAALGYLLIPEFGATGAALAILIARVLLGISSATAAWRLGHARNASDI